MESDLSEMYFNPEKRETSISIIKNRPVSGLMSRPLPRTPRGGKGGKDGPRATYSLWQARMASYRRDGKSSRAHNHKKIAAIVQVNREGTTRSKAR